MSVRTGDVICYDKHYIYRYSTLQYLFYGSSLALCLVQGHSQLPLESGAKGVLFERVQSPKMLTFYYKSG